MTELPTFDPGFTTSGLTATFSARARVARMLEVEAALGRAGAAAGVVPTEAADAIVEACTAYRAELADPEEILAEGWRSGSPVIPLLERVRARLAPSTARWLHHGATSQDIVDTALVLQVQEALLLLTAELRSLALALRRLLDDEGDLVVMARTLLQPAAAMPFGLRVARWLAPVLRHIAELDDRRATLPVQLGGPVGDLAAYGDAGPAVQRELAVRLGLRAPDLPWHTDRGPITSVVAAVGAAARTAGTIAIDLALLAQAEVGELRMRPGGSSSMHGKRNPIDAVRALAAADACAGLAAIVTGGRPHELERAAGAWQVEWFAVPLVLQTAGAALAAVGEAVASVELDHGRAAANVGEAAPPPDAAARVMIERVLAECDRVLERSP
jgi:3-carboxy-cis,cis-muconate cycloisomerase